MHDSYRTRSDDQNGVVRADIQLFESVVYTGQRFNHRCLRIAHCSARVDFHKVPLPDRFFGNNDVFGKAAVHIDPESAVIGTEVGVAGHAHIANPAADIRCDSN